MKDIYLINYSVKGIKTLDQLVSLSFYKKTISKNPDTQEYNVKGIYGMNGSGKSGIVTSVDILRNLIINPNYLNNPIVQKNLDAIINKKIGELFIEADYILKIESGVIFFRYGVTLAKNTAGKYVISYEQLSIKKATSKSDSMETMYKVVSGEIVDIRGKGDEKFSGMILTKTINLLETASVCALFGEKILIPTSNDLKKYRNVLWDSLLTLLIFGQRLHVYLDESDDHKDFIIHHSLRYLDDLENDHLKYNSLMKNVLVLNSDYLNVISVGENFVSKDRYEPFSKTVGKLYDFLHIFKSDLQSIEIDRKEDHDFWVCNLIMVYESYKIHAEFESTGLKKLIRLFAYLSEMVQGGIVFIDEFDSNLHDVYLCALLEYLMEYGKGQLCFTTHNVGPMDVLKQHKKSIDFLSVDHKIYPWTTNGNYSPSKLYRGGMIEGSPFNVDSIDFIGVFDLSGEDESWVSS